VFIRAPSVALIFRAKTRPAEAGLAEKDSERALKTRSRRRIVQGMIHENLAQSIEDLSARMIAIRDSL
jgi:hypothetical protein